MAEQDETSKLSTRLEKLETDRKVAVIVAMVLAAIFGFDAVRLTQMHSRLSNLQAQIDGFPREISKLATPIVTKLAADELSARMETIAFNARANEHLAEGNPMIIQYNETQDGAHSGWNKSTDFVAPASGKYLLMVGFTRDTHKPNFPDDDCFIDIYVADKVIASAWAGQGAGARERAVTFSIVELRQGDTVRTMSRGAKGIRRQYFNIEFSGYRI